MNAASDALRRRYATAVRALREREARLRKQIREQSALAEISRTISSSLDIHGVFAQFAAQVREGLPLDRIDVVTIDRGRGVFADLYVYDSAVPGWRQGEERRLRGSLVERVVRAGSGILVGARGGEGEGQAEPEAGTFPARFPSVIGVPLLRMGEAIGVLLVRSSSVDAYDEADVAFAERIGAQIVGAITNAQLHEETVRLAEETERRVRLEAQNRELQRAGEERNRFLSAVSHELMTPLAIIRSFVDLLVDGPAGNLTPKQREYLETIERQSRLLYLRFNDLLDASRMSAGAFSIRKAVFDVRQMLEELQEGSLRLVGARVQRLELRVSRDELWLHGDRERLLQVVSNLVDNASKYSPERTLIEVRARADGDRLRVAVRDRGVGIPKAQQHRLFVPFQRIENEMTGTVPGSGLGLAIAKGIVEAHGGEIQVESEDGAGTTVSFFVRGLVRCGPGGAGAGREGAGAGTGRPVGRGGPTPSRRGGDDGG